ISGHMRCTTACPLYIRRRDRKVRLRLYRWPGLFEGGHRLGVLIEPRHELGMFGTPFAFVPEIEIAEGAGKREMAVVGAAAPSGRALLELVERAVDLGLLALLPGRVPLLFGAESFLIDQQQRGGTASARALNYRDTRRLRCCRRLA